MKTFTARQSLGWVFLLAIGIFVLFTMVIPMLFVLDQSPSGIVILNIGLGFAIGLPFIYIALQIMKIRYILHDDHLEISMGRLIKKRINYSDIQEVIKKNLTITMWSSMRLPGLALFKVLYADEGTVFMCATAAANNVLIIKTGKEKFGITPDQENQFLMLLMEKIK